MCISSIPSNSTQTDQRRRRARVNDAVEQHKLHDQPQEQRKQQQQHNEQKSQQALKDSLFIQGQQVPTESQRPFAKLQSIAFACRLAHALRPQRQHKENTQVKGHHNAQVQEQVQEQVGQEQQEQRQ